jgi:hypothetical protein
MRGAAEAAFMAHTAVTTSIGATVVSIGAATMWIEVATASIGAVATPAAARCRVVPDEDILAVHDTMEFHLGGRSWFNLVPTNSACSDMVYSPPSYDEWPSSSW